MSSSEKARRSAAPPALSASVRDVAWYWGPAFLWIAMVLAASFDAFSAQHTGSVLLVVLNFLFGGIDRRTFEVVHFLLRKSAHVAAYGLLSALWFRALRGSLSLWQARWTLLSLVTCLAVAVGDESHQAFVRSRGGSPDDVLLDMSGALMVQLVIWWSLRRRNPSALSF